MASAMSQCLASCVESSFVWKMRVDMMRLNYRYFLSLCSYYQHIPYNVFERGIDRGLAFRNASDSRACASVLKHESRW